MGILSIVNRTENWQTAQVFAPFFGNSSACRSLAKQLLEPMGEELGEGVVKIELFWRGVREWLDGEGWKKKDEETRQSIKADYARLYNDNCQFSKLHQEIEKHSNRELPQKWNYRLAGADQEEKLFNNLRNTEIDIVLESPNHIFIGEAKCESGFGRDGKLILVHQLIRQYVMATLLVGHIFQTKQVHKTKQVVPFIVTDKEKLKSIHNSAQVKFMICKGWLKEENILSWDCITRPSPS